MLSTCQGRDSARWQINLGKCNLIVCHHKNRNAFNIFFIKKTIENLSADKTVTILKSTN